MTLDDVKAIVNDQADDIALWFDTDNIVEAYLQKALRKLHAAIEECE